MGCCIAGEDDGLNRQVQGQLSSDKSQDRQIKKLLFLGSGGSGKSTLFKQLRTIHGDGFMEKDRVSFRDHIYSQVIDQMKILIERSYELREMADEYRDLELGPEATESSEFMLVVRGDLDVNDDVAKHIKILWSDPAIQTTFENRAALKIEDSSAYFFNQVDRIAEPNYIPTDEDILYVRHRTTGVIEQKLTIKGTQFHIFDVGGQRSERKKWIHCFEHVTAVIFVSALSSYNEVMYEDETQNSLQDSLTLFDEICNSRWFISTAMILFLNKKDLFAEKIAEIPLTVCFGDLYDGNNSYDDGVEFIKTQFETLNKNPREKQIYTHITCATDRGNVEKVFNDVQHIVINTSLQKGGLL